MSRLNSYLKKINRSWVALLLLGIWVVSCKDNEFIDHSTGESGTPVTVSLNLKLASFNEPGDASTRSAESTNIHRMNIQLGDKTPHENSTEVLSRASTGSAPLYNLWVLQFGSDKKTRLATKVSTTDKPINEQVTIDVTLYTGENQTLYLVALGKKYEQIDLQYVTNITDLENFTLDCITYENGIAKPLIENDEDVPFRGSCSGINIIQLEKDGNGFIEYDKSSNFTGAIPMYAMLSKVSFDFNYQVANLSPTLLILNNVPVKYTINNPSYKPTQFVSFPALELKKEDFKDGKRKSVSWYMAPNPQGKVPAVKSETDRYFYYTSGVNTKGKAPSYGTYLNLWALDDTKKDNYALYYIFLGSNNTDDFNVYPHSHYKLSSDITIAPNMNDDRVIYKQLKQTIDFAASSTLLTSFTGTGPRSGNKYDLDVNASMRPIEITALRGTISVEILEKEDASAPMDDTSWLKLSLYPNYTEAIKKKRDLDQYALSTSITQTVTIPGIFKFYLYNDEYNKYIKATDAMVKRSLFIRFTFRTDTGSSESCIVQMDQCPGIYIGQFGGDRDPNSGMYQKGLVFDAIQQGNSNTQTVSYQYLSYYPQYISLRRGDYSDLTTERMNQYDLWNLENGKKATKSLSENPNGYSIFPTTFPSLVRPNWINGAPDLYQYKYHEIVATGGYAARYCYDKNRDSNGDGKIGEDEMVWYMPAYYQISALGLNYYCNDGMDTFKKYFVYGTEFYTTSSTTYNKEMYLCKSNTLSTISSSTSNQRYWRCVKDVDLSTEDAMPTAAKVEVADGYAVINATELLPGAYEDRVNNPKVIRPDGRVIRHKEDESTMIAERISGRFRVAPTNINPDGTPATERLSGMTWAEAASLNTAANNLPLDATSEQAETGCAVYNKESAKDGLGLWRLPTMKELFLIDAMENALVATNGATGYTALTSPIPDATPDYSLRYCYWTATEYTSSPSSTTTIKDVYYLELYYYMAADKNKETKRKHITTGNKIISYPIVKNYNARCIQDLHF